MNKRGQGIGVETIVLIIVALVVLAVVVYGFTVGWGNLWQSLTSLGGGKVNVQTVIQGCQVSCSTSATYDYCNKVRDVTFTSGSKPESLRCKDLEGRGVGLEVCSNLDCGEKKTCAQLGGNSWGTTPCNAANQKDLSSVVTDTTDRPAPTDKIKNYYCCAPLS